MIAQMVNANPNQLPLQKLQDGLARLEMVFLPKQKVAPPATYSDDELTSAKAYLVFAHAELEDYLEACCRQKAACALEALVTSGTAGITALSLVSHFGVSLSVASDIVKYQERYTKLAPDFPNHNPNVTRPLLARLKDAVSAYVEQCHKNNGVKEKDLLQLLIPLGISPFEMDPAWIAEMNAFGVDRGSHAHRGLSGVQQITDPFLSQQRMMRILNGPPGSALPTAGSSFRIFSLHSLDEFLAS